MLVGWMEGREWIELDVERGEERVEDKGKFERWVR